MPHTFSAEAIPYLGISTADGCLGLDGNIDRLIIIRDNGTRLATVRLIRQGVARFTPPLVAGRTIAVSEALAASRDKASRWQAWIGGCSDG